MQRLIDVDRKFDTKGATLIIIRAFIAAAVWGVASGVPRSVLGGKNSG